MLELTNWNRYSHRLTFSIQTQLCSRCSPEWHQSTNLFDIPKSMTYKSKVFLLCFWHCTLVDHGLRLRHIPLLILLHRLWILRPLPPSASDLYLPIALCTGPKPLIHQPITFHSIKTCILCSLSESIPSTYQEALGGAT